MADLTKMRSAAACRDCQVGYHAPFDRFEQLALIPDGPTFLKRCNVCGSLWQESLQDARLLTPPEAATLFRGYAAQDSGHAG